MNTCSFCGLFSYARILRLSFLLSAVLVSLPAFAQFPGLPGCSQQFYRDVMAAERMVNEKQSVEPVLALQQRYSNELEQVSLEISIGVDFGQRTGVVNPTNAVVHFTTALDYDNLPDKTRLEILLWRGNSLEQMGKLDEAMKDYLRGLLECSFHDLTGGWPEILHPKAAMYINSRDPENPQRVRDYNRYRRHIDFKQFLLRQRYFLVDAAKRVWQDKSDADLLDNFKSISPDLDRNEKIIESLKSENKRPWP